MSEQAKPFGAYDGVGPADTLEQHQGTPTRPLPGPASPSQFNTAATPPAATQLTPYHPPPAEWAANISRVMGYYLALFAEQGQPAVDQAEAWVKKARAGGGNPV